MAALTWCLDNKSLVMSNSYKFQSEKHPPPAIALALRYNTWVKPLVSAILLAWIRPPAIDPAQVAQGVRKDSPALTAIQDQQLCSQGDCL